MSSGLRDFKESAAHHRRKELPTWVGLQGRTTADARNVPIGYADSAAIRAGFQVRAGTLRVWAHRGWVTTVRSGKHVFYRVEDVERHAQRVGILDHSGDAV